MNRHALRFASAAAAAVLCASFASAQEGAPSATPTPPPAPAWGYDGATGPQHWGTLQAEYATCARGREQSPIDLRGGDFVDGDAEAAYAPSGGVAVHRGHSVQVDLEPGSSLTVQGVRYELLQMHVHHPSEHAQDGEAYAAEVHYVHRAADGRVAVLGTLVEVGDADPAWDALLAALPATSGETARLAAPVDPGALVGLRRLADESVWRYGGSLTTPPCNEGVQWVVRSAPMQLSAAQLERIRGLTGPNARPLQPLGRRALGVTP